MAGPRGRPPARLIDRLRAEPHRFGFFQAVRVLARLGRARGAGASLGGDAAPAEEPVRFATHLPLSFPASQVAGLELPEDGGVPRLAVPFMGLAGPAGVLPQHYAELAVTATRRRQTALRDFLDLFTHRLVSLFARAGSRYRVAELVEAADPPGSDLFTAAARAIAGLPARPSGGLAGEVEALALAQAGLLGAQSRSASRLEALLAAALGLPVRVEQLRGSWLRLPEGERSRLGGPLARLGDGAMLGGRAWDIRSGFRVVAGPLGPGDFAGLLPDQPAFHRLWGLAEAFARQDLWFDVQLVAAPGAATQASLGAGGARLGLTAWLGGPGLARQRGDTVARRPLLPAAPGAGAGRGGRGG